ncbi:MAG: MoaD/ThiS family protein [Chitinophagaceae bacterium]|nr:MAG: MoaD/ThiS family protein [Chitinophagaceae bacterium]
MIGILYVFVIGDVIMQYLSGQEAKAKYQENQQSSETKYRLVVKLHLLHCCKYIEILIIRLSRKRKGVTFVDTLMIMSIKVLFFGQLAEISGTDVLETEVRTDTAALKRFLETEFPGLQQMVFNIAVNSEIIETQAQLQAGDTVALLPPFSGG